MQKLRSAPHVAWAVVTVIDKDTRVLAVAMLNSRKRWWKRVCGRERPMRGCYT